MAAPLLTISEQNRSLSGKKRLKRVVKNVLGLPSNLVIEPRVAGEKDVIKLNEILKRLLPSARLLNDDNLKVNKNNESKETSCVDFEILEQARKKRCQLSLGVNEVNKNIQKNLIAAVLLASDIQPKFFIHHLNLLCHQNNIPFLHIPNLRDLVKNCLGFPCIAVGFKKNFCDFLEAVNEIKTVFETLSIFLKNSNKEESLLPNSESESEEVSGTEEGNKNKEQSEVIPFTFLYRTSTKERVFVPETSESSSKVLEKSKIDFIFVSSEDDEVEIKKQPSKLGISSNLLRKSKKFNKQIQKKNSELSSTDDEEEDLEVPKKKVKKNWMIDKVGDRKKFKYHPANVRKIHSNPNRSKKKKCFLSAEVI